MPLVLTLTDPVFRTGMPASDQKLLRILIVFACIVQGVHYYFGFVRILALGGRTR